MEREVNGFTVCSLLYGDHLRLHHRNLQSILGNLDPTLVRSWRILLNEVTHDTRRLVESVAGLVPPETQLLAYDSPVNRLKYPMMRKAIYDPANPVVTPFVMWFDDDSCLGPLATEAWWAGAYAAMQRADVLGSLYRMRLQGNQAAGIKAQPWYAGLDLTPSQVVTFATGGWWCARTRVLQQWDYPFKDITHNGGDVVLGELCRQQRLRLVNARQGVWVNADDAGRPSKAPRRGASRPPVWSDFTPEKVYDHAHHDFEVEGRDPRQSPPSQTRQPRPPQPPTQRRGVPRVPGL